ncbi:DUF1917-domain-containing protein [Dothidotthia symphoricarpi CBS 119687]|uniref:DUF1917-domain-containing protein n=1 Tax=Dothidotthia symphoricarpi CBS 119687 TaxID=1392245 RepID=A0A6A6AVE5_9PLEO|nr:DUF1917-domain-containing protein [Dothidotthia symphoricarpi CBS 119687]KAF2134827.1 DUF1917-domain-containing protein [Dothidotthia symphoricarpi CBS 119687]
MHNKVDEDEQNMVPGDGWISEDSSFYGDEDEQERQQSLCQGFTHKSFWSTHDSDLNAITSPVRTRRIINAAPDSNTFTPSKPSGSFPLDRKSMEADRLARLGSKRKRDLPSEQPSQALEQFNPRQGCSDSWQLGEAVDDFVRRLPPLTTSISTCDWIWAANPHRDPQDKPNYPRVADFKERGSSLLEQSLKVRRDTQNNNAGTAKGAVTRRLNQESKTLQQNLTELAVETGVLSGKWMLFLKLEDITRVWKKIVDAVINNRLGPIVKIAPEDGNPDERLVCIYTRDFRQEEDVLRVLRVLQELVAMGLTGSGKPLYYKSDAYTHLDIYSRTATEYGLQASLYNSSKMLAEARLPKSTSMPPKKQSKLTKF